MYIVQQTIMYFDVPYCSTSSVAGKWKIYIFVDCAKVSNYLCCKAATVKKNSPLSMLIIFLFFFLHVLPQVPKLCPLNILLNPVFKKMQLPVS